MTTRPVIERAAFIAGAMIGALLARLLDALGGPTPE